MLRNPAARYGCELRERETGTVDDAIGRALVAAGIAVCVDPPKPVEAKPVPPKPAEPKPLLAVPDAPAIASGTDQDIKAKAAKLAKAKPQADQAKPQADQAKPQAD